MPEYWLYGTRVNSDIPLCEAEYPPPYSCELDPLALELKRGLVPPCAQACRAPLQRGLSGTLETINRDRNHNAIYKLSQLRPRCAR